MSEHAFKYTISKNVKDSTFLIEVFVAGGFYSLHGDMDKLYKKLKTLKGRNVVSRANFEFYYDACNTKFDYDKEDYTLIERNVIRPADAIEMHDEDRYPNVNVQVYSPSAMRDIVAKARVVLFNERWWNGED